MVGAMGDTRKQRQSISLSCFTLQGEARFSHIIPNQEQKLQHVNSQQHE